MITATITNNVFDAELISGEITASVTNNTIVAEIGNSTTTYIYSDLARIETTISFADFVTGYKSIGNIPADRRVHKVSVLITSAFNVGTMTIGESAAHGRLMIAADNNLLSVNEYHTEPDYKYLTETEIKAWFETGAPTQGSATIIIYYS